MNNHIGAIVSFYPTKKIFFRQVLPIPRSLQRNFQHYSLLRGVFQNYSTLSAKKSSCFCSLPTWSISKCLCYSTMEVQTIILLFEENSPHDSSEQRFCWPTQLLFIFSHFHLSLLSFNPFREQADDVVCGFPIHCDEETQTLHMIVHNHFLGIDSEKDETINSQYDSEKGNTPSISPEASPPSSNLKEKNFDFEFYGEPGSEKGEEKGEENSPFMIV